MDLTADGQQHSRCRPCSSVWFRWRFASQQPGKIPDLATCSVSGERCIGPSQCEGGLCTETDGYCTTRWSGDVTVIMSLSTCRVLCFRLGPGQELVTELVARCQEAGLRAAFIVTCVGSTSSCRLRLASTQDGRTDTFMDCCEFLEICSLVGTVSVDGVHLHVTLGRADGSTLAGHVISLTMQTTAEIVVGEAEQLVFSREHDTGTGFRELVVRDRQS